VTILLIQTLTDQQCGFQPDIMLVITDAGIRMPIGCVRQVTLARRFSPSST